MSKLPIKGEYPPDWPEINQRACDESGHRCIRCGHPYRKGAHGNGQWSHCDEQCTHRGPHGFIYPSGEVHPIPSDLPTQMLLQAAKDSEACPKGVVAEWRILTVHHLDGNKANCSWFNLLALCQRCHLHIQGHVNPHQPYMFEHDEWFKPYAAGFYAKKYEGREITRGEAHARMAELLAYERLA